MNFNYLQIQLKSERPQYRMKVNLLTSAKHNYSDTKNRILKKQTIIILQYQIHKKCVKYVDRFYRLQTLWS